MFRIVPEKVPEALLLPKRKVLEPALASHMATADEFRTRTTELLARRDKLFEKYAPAVIELDLEPVLGALERGGGADVDRIRGQDAPADRAVRQRTALERATSDIQVALRGLRTVSGDFARRLGVGEPTSIAATRRIASLADLVLQNPRPLPSW